MLAKLIHASSKMELAKLIVQSAPGKARGFSIARRVPPSAWVVQYSTTLLGGYLSLGKLAMELGLAVREEKYKPVPKPAGEVWAKWRRGSSGWIVA